jgi:hypothetical protein
MTLGLQSGFEVQAFDTLSEAGVSASVLTSGVNLCFQVTVSDIGTNVVIRFEGSLDDTNFFNLDQSNSDTTITANGTYGYALAGCPVQYVRVRLVSFNGGTPSIASKVGTI